MALLCTGCAKSGGGVRMSAGERLYRANCRSCHSLRRPESHADNEWPRLVKRYGDKIHLTAAEQTEIIQYLMDAN